ncbi:MAG: dihydrofolate reductase [Comamonadaceae bacterium]|nr:dihydrofolate reductase [Comamonadaceae bacterium]
MREALPLRATTLVLTEIDADFDGDAFFPAWDRAAFDRSAGAAARSRRPACPIVSSPTSAATAATAQRR